MATAFDPLTQLPARITVADFKDRYLAAFPRFTNPTNDVILLDAIEAIYIMFDGINRLWKSTDIETWCNKTGQCYLLLIAWYVVNMYPRMAAGIHSMGGLPILSKKIGDVSIHYLDTSRLNTADSVLESLRTNTYGNMALTMIRSSARRFTISVLNL